MKALVITYMLLLPLATFSQSSSLPSLTPVRGMNTNQGGLSGTGLKYNDGSYVNEKETEIKGSPFLYEDWKKGNVLLRTKERIDSILVKYNLYTDLLQVKVEEQEYQFNIEVWEFLLPDPVIGGAALFRSGFPQAPGMTEKSFYQVLYDGKTKYLLKHKKAITSELTSTPGVKARVFEGDQTYYILTTHGKMEKLKKKNKSILDLFPDKKEELKKMTDQQKLKLDKDEQIIVLLEYYDLLQQ